MKKNNCIVLTGAMGAGKSTVLNRLKELGYKCIVEPARIVLAEQRATGGEGVPESNPGLFIKLMLEKTASEYENITPGDGTVFFDRGFADLAAYANLFGLPSDFYTKISQEFRFNNNVFFFNGWEGIYTTDNERKMSYQAADEFGKNARLIYEKLDYKLINVPNRSIEERVEFIFKHL